MEESLVSYILAAGGIIIFLTASIVIAGQYSSSLEVNRDIEHFSLIQRAKSIINTLDSAESGEVTQILPEKMRVNVITDSKGVFLKVGKYSEKLDALVQDSSVESEKIVFIKTRGKPVEISFG